VNKTDSAVRITHIPTNISVQCQSQRSQHQNKATALKILESRLYEIENKKRNEQKLQDKSSLDEATFGNQIRSYVLQPYKMVKDLRTGHETNQPEQVLQGGPELTRILKSLLLYLCS
jgi:peptide chain release factor 2